jgi:hypothetical protein
MAIGPVNPAVVTKAITSATETALEEAQETAQETKAEATKGDQQAKTKLAHEAAAKRVYDVNRPSPEVATPASSVRQPATVVNISESAKDLQVKAKV